MQNRSGVTNSVFVRDLDDYCTTANSSFVPLEISPESSVALAGRFSAANADDTVFTEVDATPQLVSRTSETIQRGGSGYYKVSLLLAGSSVLIQDGREVVMQPGDISFYDTSRPYSLLFDEKFRNLIMMFPKDRLKFPSVLVDSLTAVSLGQQHPLAKLAARFIAQASPQLPALFPVSRNKLARTSLELINTMFSAILDVETETGDPQKMLFHRINSYIDANLSSPDLSPSRIAAAHYISLRNLHAQFAEQSMTVSSVIRQRRLENCRAELTDPLLAEQPIAAIASRWGFVDASHFSRLFKAAYGVSPRELRARQPY